MVMSNARLHVIKYVSSQETIPDVACRVHLYFVKSYKWCMSSFVKQNTIFKAEQLNTVVSVRSVTRRHLYFNYEYDNLFVISQVTRNLLL